MKIQSNSLNQLFTLKFFLILIVAITILKGHVFVTHAQEVSGQITLPINGYQVAPRFKIEGTISNLPDGYHLWIAVRKGNLMWPKEPEAFVIGTNWGTTISENSRGEYSLILLAVNSDGHNNIMEWIRIGNETSHFPGYISIPGSQSLCSITVVGN